MAIITTVASAQRSGTDQSPVYPFPLGYQVVSCRLTMAQADIDAAGLTIDLKVMAENGDGVWYELCGATGWQSGYATRYPGMTRTAPQVTWNGGGAPTPLQVYVVWTFSKRTPAGAVIEGF